MHESPHQKIQILLLDDHALFRESLARLLASEPGFEVAGCSGAVDEAIGILRQKQIDIVLLDFDLGQRNGAQFLRLAEDQGFKGKVLVVTAGVDEREAAELIHMGISGVFMKHNSPALLAEAIRDVMAGKVWFEQELLQAAMKINAAPASEREGERFTQRERQVLSYVFEGLANKEIAAQLGISESSVKATLQQLFSKTGVRTRSQLVRIALEQHKNEF